MFDPETLISLYLNSDGKLEPEQLEQLSEWILEDSRNAAQFARATFLHRAIYDSLSGGDMQSNILSDVQADNPDKFWETAAWQEMAKSEKTAPVVPVEEPPKKPIEPIVTKIVKPKREKPKFPVFTVLLTSAAMLFISLMVVLSPVRPPVAVLTDSINAQWEGTKDIPGIGDVLREGDKMILARGVAEITFDDGAVVLIESPAEIKLETPYSMFTASGKVTAVVSKYATGFTVNTPYASVVDLGTEFGVDVDNDGSCSLHMFKGKANLIAGKKGEERISQIVLERNAKSVDSTTGDIEDVKLDESVFVRKIDSEAGLIWWGEPFDLSVAVTDSNDLSKTRYATAEITVGNADFEDVKVEPGGYTYDSKPWNVSNDNEGYQAWLSNGYYDGEPRPASTALVSTGSDNIFQKLKAKFIEGATYTFSMDIGGRISQLDDDGFSWTLYFYDTDVNQYKHLKEASGSVYNGADWTKRQVTYTARAADAGKAIGIGFTSRQDYYTYFDNAAVTVSVSTTDGADPNEILSYMQIDEIIIK